MKAPTQHLTDDAVAEVKAQAIATATGNGFVPALVGNFAEVVDAEGQQLTTLTASEGTEPIELHELVRRGFVLVHQ